MPSDKQTCVFQVDEEGLVSGLYKGDGRDFHFSTRWVDASSLPWWGEGEPPKREGKVLILDWMEL